MISAMAYMMMYLSFGVMTVRFLLPRHRPLNRIWLGLSLGVLEEMWLPALFAFMIGFTETAHILAAVAAAGITLICSAARDRRDPAGWDRKEKDLMRQMLLIALPLTILSAYLQVTHVMRVATDGSWHVGQSTYGDLPMHLSFITNLVNKKYPADYPFYPGSRLSYPFLADSLSSTFYLFGSSLQASTVIPATLMMALCYMGVLVLAREMTGGKRTVALAALLFFLNGGLGFLYDFDLAGGTNTAGEPVWVERIRAILDGFYKTPTNQPTPNNLRWSNVICDMMIPQRTLLGGWCMVIPCFYLLDRALRPRKVHEDRSMRALILLAVWAGALPLIHTHSFLALGLMSFGALVFDMIHGDPKTLINRRRSRGRILGRYAVYGGIALALALPQLIFFTFGQALNGSASHSFITLQFNWVNNPSGRGLIDDYWWFYIKNIGLPFIALMMSIFEWNPRHRRIWAMMIPVILAAELIRFQPNEYDNNKLFYLAWLMGCMIAADWFAAVWRKLRGLRGRYVLAVFAAIVTFLSAGLTVARECVSDYMAFSASSVKAGEFARDDTPAEAVYMTGTQHLNPVLSIAGKTIVCGPDLWLYWHGFDTTERKNEIRAFYEDPDHNADVLQKYGVSYIYVSSYERNDYLVDEEALRREYPVVFENAEATIYRVPEG